MERNPVNCTSSQLVLKTMTKPCDILRLAVDPGAIGGLLTWPTFSVTSYLMISGLVRQNISPMTVIDIGANTGQFAVAAAKLWPMATILSFEPQPACYRRLRDCADKVRNIKTFNVALGSKREVKAMRINAHHHSSSFLPMTENHLAAFPEATESGTEMTEIVPLDDALSGENLRGQVLLKIDVQGYESFVLEGARNTLQFTDYVVLETSFKPLYEGEKLFGDIVEMMRDYGFRFLRPVGFLTDGKTDEILQMDALFVR